MVAEILSVGTELLLGEIINTNTAFLSQECAKLGLSVFRQTTVGDNFNRIVEALDKAFAHAHIVIVSGGLGPTSDDLTKEAAAHFFNKPLLLHQPSLKKIEAFFKKIEKPMPKGNEKQALYLQDSEVLFNSKGSAPGIYLKEKNQILVLLPGPPLEMQTMWQEQCVPRFQELAQETIFSKTLRIFGLGESEMAQRVLPLLEQSQNPTIAPYASNFESSLRITAKAESQKKAQELIQTAETQIRSFIGDWIYGVGQTSLAETVAKLLLDKKQTIAVAESCTGGLIASKLVAYPNISRCFLQGQVVYTNEAKIKNLGVQESTLQQYGAVSQEVVKEMALGMAKVSGADITLSVSGIAGPSGGTKEKPVGTVWGGLYFQNKVESRLFKLFGTREQIQERASLSMLFWLWQTLLKNP